MRIQTFIIVSLASLSFAASAENYIINQAYEIPVSDLRLPENVVGSVSFKDCTSCDTQTVRVNTDTRYVLNYRDVSLADFRNAVNTIANKKTRIATVIHHLESNTIVALHVVRK